MYGLPIAPEKSTTRSLSFVMLKLARAMSALCHGIESVSILIIHVLSFYK